MLSYRHAFHAGNHADVLKHALLVQSLEYLKRKDKPFLYIDTHAGAGLYDLTAPWAQKNREYAGGVGRLLDCPELPEGLALYVDLIRSMNQGGPLQRYPGSPWLAVQLLREQDKARLFELHPAEFDALRALFGRDRRVRVAQEDGFSLLPSLLPPTQRRALVLIDPPYEVKQDYVTAVTALQAAWKRFPAAICLLWYPLVNRAAIERLERDVKNSGIRDVLQVELGVAPETSGGMQASGLIIINAPWTLKTGLAPQLQFLADVLGVDGRGSYRLTTLAGE